jgi:N-acetylneuraminic acid mutarotase
MAAHWRALAVGVAVVACSSGDKDSSALGASDSAGEPPVGELRPAPGEYGTRTQLLAPNSEMAVAELNGKIYVLGGYPSSRVVQSTVQVYDVAADSWSMGPALPVPTHHPVVVGVAGKLYSMGGQHEGDANGGRAFSLEPSEGVWTELMPMPTPRGGGAAAVIDDKIYVAGGRPPAGNAFEVYVISQGTWSVLANLPLAFNDRNHLAAAAIAGKIYVAGGRYDGGNVACPITDSLDVYDPAANTWASAAPLLRPRGGVNGIAAHGCFHVWGGEGSNIGEPNNVFPDHDVYHPITDTWTSLARLPTPVHGVTGAAFLDGLIYIPGGGTASGGNSGSVIHQVYRPEARCE